MDLLFSKINNHSQERQATSLTYGRLCPAQNTFTESTEVFP
jgi:hypothetical protein